jgi:starvation-inducible DNA-binding protein
MHTTRNDLAIEVRTTIAELLNARLADTIDLYLQTKHAHWNVKGPHFIALHELFDKLAEDLEDHIDDMAERAVALGGVAEGTLGTIAKRTQVKAYPAAIRDGSAHVDALADAYAAVGKAVRKAIEESGKLGDADTSDLFTAISRDLDKSLWFLEAHRQANG